MNKIVIIIVLILCNTAFFYCVPKKHIAIGKSERFEKIFDKNFYPIDLNVYFDTSAQIIVTNKIYSLSEDKVPYFTEIFQYQLEEDSVFTIAKYDYKIDSLANRPIEFINEKVYLDEDAALVLDNLPNQLLTEYKNLYKNKTVYYITEIELEKLKDLILIFFKEKEEDKIHLYLKENKKFQDFGILHLSDLDNVNLFIRTFDIDVDGVKELCVFKTLPYGTFGTVNLQIFKYKN